ncbi:MAG: DNA internalization-related competence protein ComEC/Rec2 [Candidatus Saccharibacteria bacterium]
MWILAGLAAGIATAEWGDLIYLALLIAFGIVLFLVFREKKHFCWIAALVFGFVYWSWMHPLPPDLSDRHYFHSSALVIDDPVTKDEQLRFTIETPEKTRLRAICAFTKDIRKYDRIEVSGSLRRIKGPSNPGEFDFREYFSHRGIFFNLSIKRPGEVKVISNEANWYQRILSSIITQSDYAIRGNMDATSAVLLEGMLFGFQGEISEEDLATFQKTGLVHMFSVSGFHVAFVVGIGVLAANTLGWNKRNRFLAVSALILFYGFLTGWPSPLVRSAIMAWLGLTAYYFGREDDLLTSLSLSGILILLYNPANLFEISFQLSFLATWGIVYMYPRWQEMAEPDRPWKEAFMVSLSPQLATLPLASYYFNLISLISVIANFLLAGLAGAAVFIGFLGIFMAQLNQTLASLFMIPAGFLTKLITLGAGYLAQIPSSYMWVAKPSIISVILAYSAFLLVLWNTPSIRKLRLATGTAFLAVFLLSILIPGQLWDWGKMKVVFLDVGQGDCIFIKTAQGYSIMVDGGGSDFYDVGKNTVLPFLHREGIRELDMIIVSHPHVDHLKGLVPILKECPVHTIIAGKETFLALPGYAGQTITSIGLKVITLPDGTIIRTWSPESPAEDDNETSVLTRIDLGRTSLLLTGDAGQKELEQSLLVPEMRKPATIYKAPHHGSKYAWSEAFFAHIKPIYSVIQVGANNPFGHPNIPVVNNMHKFGSEIYRTDQNGAVIFTSDGNDLTVETTKTNN